MPVSPDAIHLASIDLPDFGEPTVEPAIPPQTYAERQAEALRRCGERGLAALVVYGDREHSASIAFLTGYDPRFEEALLVMVPGRRASLVVGNEGWAYAELAPGPFDRVLCQTFSLLGQPRERNRALAEILAEAGVIKGQRVGVAGWKYFGPEDPGSDDSWLDTPEFIATAIRRTVGREGLVVNATALFMNPADGLRAINDVDQLAWFEMASTFCSNGMRALLQGLRIGMHEREASRLMTPSGLPLGAHLMLSSGARAPVGLPSPSMKRLERGDPFTAALCVWGALNARAGFLVEDADELPAAIRDYVERLVKPYFAAAVDWYETIGIGVTGGDLHAAVHHHLGDAFFGVGLNPGHLIHMDEWLHSPIFEGSELPIRSGMALQIDIIPATNSPYFTTNVEDGIAIADAPLRDAFRDKYPEAWRRIEARRGFLRESLGIRLKPEVLPLSNIQAYLPPLLLAPNRVMCVKR